MNEKIYLKKFLIFQIRSYLALSQEQFFVIKNYLNSLNK
jgi:hypothetical protein